MKPILLTTLLFFSLQVFSQQTNPTQTLIKQDYLKKSKNQKTTAWVLLGGGVLAGGIGLASAVGSVCIGCPEKPKDQSGWAIAGGALVVSSIPFFIASSKNKKKAAAISFKMEKTPALQQQGFVYHSYAALTLKIAIQ
jgi:hypothetical protein